MAFSFFKKKSKSKGHKDHYHNLLVKDVVKEIEEAITIVFEQPEEKLVYKSVSF